MSWLDSKVATCAPNYVTCNPVSTAQRWSKSTKKGVDVPMPKPFEYCNKQKGGVDLLDHFVSTYRVCVRSKKWWLPFFAWAVNASVANTWNFCTVQKQKSGMSEFQREVVMTILTSFERKKPAKALAFPRNVPSNVKLDIKNHILVKCTSKYYCCKNCGGKHYRNCMLPYTLTVSETIIHETQNLLYYFLREVLIM